MSQKVFITDCEGPLTLNDNAFEIAEEFIPRGDELFKILSNYDDYLVDIEKRENYNAGNTLKLISPFFKLFNLSNNDLINFSKENIFTVKGSKETLKLANTELKSYIVSTSYGQYIEALSNYMNFPFENTYFTKLDLDKFTLKVDEEEILKSFYKKILESNLITSFQEILNKGSVEDKNNLKEEIDGLNKIFFEDIPKMDIFNLMDSVKTVGGKGKQIAVEEILNKLDTDPIKAIYIGDSITDVEPLKYIHENGGISISFNGNEYSLSVAEIAIISENTIASSLIIDLFSRFGKQYIYGFIEAYSKNPENVFEGFLVKHNLMDEFKETFKNKDYPIIAFINDENKEELLKLSKEMRNKIRGRNIGSLA